MPSFPKPLYVVHADLGISPIKRWIACASIDINGLIRAGAPQKVTDAAKLLSKRSKELPSASPSFFGFDFPIGLPQAPRAENAKAMLAWAEKCGVELATDLRAEIRDGFGSSANGEDRFDAVVGLFGMLNVLLGHRPSGEPRDDPKLVVEGWILGHDHRA